MGTKTCNHCHQIKDEEEFSWRYKALGIRNNSCKACQQAFNKTYYDGEAKDRHLKQVRERADKAREAAREFVYQHLLTHPCEVCGESDPRVLEFHHVGDKDREITTLISGGYSLDRIQAEIDKCHVRGKRLTPIAR